MLKRTTFQRVDNSMARLMVSRGLFCILKGPFALLTVGIADKAERYLANFRRFLNFDHRISKNAICRNVLRSSQLRLKFPDAK